MGSRALESDKAPMGFHDFLADGQPQSCPMFFRGEKRLKQVGKKGFVDAGAGIPHLEEKVVVLGVGRKGQGSFIFHGLERVPDDIHQNLLEAFPIRL